MCYLQSVSFIEFLMDVCTYDFILDTIWFTDKKLLHFKLSKSGHILGVNKTSFPRPGHIYTYNDIHCPAQISVADEHQYKLLSSQ